MRGTPRKRSLRSVVRGVISHVVVARTFRRKSEQLREPREIVVPADDHRVVVGCAVDEKKLFWFMRRFKERGRKTRRNQMVARAMRDEHRHSDMADLRERVEFLRQQEPRG